MNWKKTGLKGVRAWVHKHSLFGPSAEFMYETTMAIIEIKIEQTGYQK